MASYSVGGWSRGKYSSYGYTSRYSKQRAAIKSSLNKTTVKNLWTQQTAAAANIFSIQSSSVVSMSSQAIKGAAAARQVAAIDQALKDLNSIDITV